MSSQVTIWETIANTPWWMFVMFAFFLWAGYSATKPSTLPLKNLIILPILFAAISVFNLISLVNFTTMNVMAWSICLILGMIFGWLQFRIMKIHLIENKSKVQMPGNYSLLVFVLVLFSVKHYYGFDFSFNPSFFKDPLHQNIFMSIYGALTGIFAGRLWYTRQLLTRPETRAI